MHRGSRADLEKCRPRAGRSLHCYQIGTKGKMKLSMKVTVKEKCAGHSVVGAENRNPTCINDK